MTLSNLNTTWNNAALKAWATSKGVTTAPDPTSYVEARDLAIKVIENPLLYRYYLGTYGNPEKTHIHNDGANIPTIGYGFNLRNLDVTAGEYASIFQAVFGTLTQAQTDATQLLDAWRSHTPFNIVVSGTPTLILLTDLDIIAGGQGTSAVDEGRNLSANAMAALNAALSPLASLTLNETQATELLHLDLNGLPGVLPSREATVTSLLGANAALSNSMERVALLSMSYQALSLIGSGLRGAIADDKRALAWWEIRFNNQYVAAFETRRNAESNMFGLISEVGKAAVDLNEYKTAMGLLFEGTSLGLSPANPYDKTTNDTHYGVQKFMDAVDPAMDVLESAYARSPTGQIIEVDIIQTDLANTNSINAKSAAGGKNDTNTINLIFGGDGDDTIHGLGGNDFLYGDGDKDHLYGDDGDDSLYGGAGSDVLNGGKGENYLDGGEDANNLDEDIVVFDSDPTGEVAKLVQSINGGSNKPDGSWTVDRGAAGKDRITGFEKIALGNERNVLAPVGVIHAQSLQKISIEASGTDDLLDYSLAGAGVNIGAGVEALGQYENYEPTKTEIQFIWNAIVKGPDIAGPGFTGATGIELTDFESLIGSNFNDNLGLHWFNPGGALTAAEEQQFKDAHEIYGSATDPALVGAIFDQRMMAAAAIAQNQIDVTIDAGAGDDRVSGTHTGHNIINGGAGNDTLIAGDFTSTINGGDGDDRLVGGGLKSQLFGGAGSDLFSLENNSFAMDATKNDYVAWGDSFILTGGVKASWMEGDWAYWAPFSSILGALPLPSLNIGAAMFYLLDANTMTTFRYAVTESDQLVVQFGRGRGGQAVIENYRLDTSTGDATGHVVVFQQTPIAPGKATLQDMHDYLNLAYRAGFGIDLFGSDPLVLDLDGDGLELARRDSSFVWFDVDNDGFAERTGWIKGGDGVLARDLNSNGVIDNVSELFGDATTSGFSALAALDTNSDGKITSSDAAFSTLRVWKDLDSDAETDAGELLTLADAGVAEISLGNTTASTDINGNIVRAQGSFTRVGGGSGAIADVVLDVYQTDSHYLGSTTISPAAAALPDLKGYGNLQRLQAAMSTDATLLGLVSALPAAGSITSWTQMQAAAASILYRWAGADGVTPTSLGSGMDRQKLAFLETYLGYQLAPRDGSGNPTSVNAAELAATWQDILSKTTIRLFAQGPLADIFQDVAYNVDTDRLYAASPTDLGDAFAGIIAALPSTGAATALSDLWGPAAKAFMAALVRADKYDIRTDYAMQALVAATTSVSPPLSLAELAAGIGLTQTRIGGAGGDLLSRGGADGLGTYVGGAGNDVMTGGAGQDVYVFGSNFGQDEINDAEAFDAGDRLRFANLNSDQVTMKRIGTDLVVTVNGSTDKVTVKNQFAAPKIMPGGVPITPDYGVEEIQFKDGKVVEAIDIMAAVGLGTNASETLDGTGLADEIEGLLGNDTLRGGDNGDTYYYTRGDGSDVIDDVMTNPLFRNADSLILMGGIGLTDLRVERVGASADIKLFVDDANSSILLKNQAAYTALGYDGQYALNNRIEAIFADGMTLNWLDLQDMTIRTYTTDANDTTYGFGTSDQFYASAGDDTLIGLDGGDTYAFGRGSGHDTIHDQRQYLDTFVSGILGHSWGADDVVTFGFGVTADDVDFARISGTKDLLVTIRDTGDSLRITNQFDGRMMDLFGLIGLQWFDKIETFKFADGATKTWQDVLQIVTTGGDGNETLVGDFYADTLDGKAGNDFLDGADDGDTYLFGRGDGQDVISDNPGYVIYPAADTLQFKAGVAVSDVVFARDGATDDLLISIAGTIDQIRIVKQYEVIETGPFGAQAAHQIEQFKWADGTTKTWAQVAAAIIDAAGTSGNDTIIGTHGNDTIRGRGGNDTLKGGNSSDTYIFNLGDGADTIDDYAGNILAGNEDTVSFGAGIAPEDIQIQRSGANDVILKVAGTTDQVTIKGQFDYTTLNIRFNEIEHIAFANGASWSTADLRAKAIAQSTTSGDDTISGFWSNDILNGGAGNDVLRGGDGSDTYVFGANFGVDRIEESVGLVTYADVDIVQFASGYTSTNALLTRSGNDLIIGFTGSSDQVTIAGQFSHTAYFEGWTDIESVTFGDNVTWTDADIRARLIAAQVTSGNDTINGFYTADTIDGGAGSDTLKGGGGGDSYVFGKGSGNDIIDENFGNLWEDIPDTVSFASNVARSEVTFTRTGNDMAITIAGVTDTLTIKDHFTSDKLHLVEFFKFANGSTMTAAEAAVNATASQATSGNDSILGTTNADVLDGGAGNDWMNGGRGNDTYKFNIGSGQDVIWDTPPGFGDADDRVVFGPGITPDNLTFTRNSNNGLVIQVNGTSDKLTIDGQLASVLSWTYDGAVRVERFQFDDGTQMLGSDIEAIILNNLQTAGNDSIKGWDIDDTIDGKAGNDFMAGAYGNDTYRFGRGYGQDVIQDAISNSGDLNDRVLFNADVAQSDLTFQRSGNNLVIKINGTVDQLTINEQLTSADSASWDGKQRIERFEFADGYSLTAAQVDLLALQGMKTSGNDTIVAYSSNDRLDGGGGNDTLTGGRGNDTYVFARGYGQDTIWDANSNSGDLNDTIEFGDNIAYSDLTLLRSGNNLVIKINGTTDQLTIGNQLLSANSASLDGVHRIENFVFKDGTKITGLEMNEIILRGQQTTCNDTVVAYEWDETLDGGAGNDALVGGRGSDAYLFGRGYGQDTIWEAMAISGDLNDRVLFKSGIAPSDLVLTRSGADLRIAIAGTTDQLIIPGELSAWNGYVENFMFANGDIWTREQMTTALFAQITTEGNDTVDGYDLNDTINGKGGVDSIHGWNGDDTLYGGAGNDSLYADNGNDFADGGVGDDLVAGWSGNDTLYGGDGNDTLYTDDGNDFADGGDGNDVLSGSNGDDILRGGNGNDLVVGDGGNDTMYGDAGNDTMNGGNGSDVYKVAAGFGVDTIEDNGQPTGAATDKIHFTDLNSGDLVFGLANGGLDLTIGVAGGSDALTVKNEFTVNDLDWIEQIQFADGTIWNRTQIKTAVGLPPVVLDLDGDGVELVSRSASTVMFDTDSNGIAQKTGWVAADDCILALDRNGDGLINGGAEISFVLDWASASTDLEGLRGFDSNNDGALSAADSRFADFRIWQDANQDGVSQIEELRSLVERGIAAISLTGEQPGERSAGGVENAILSQGTFTYLDGRSGRLADVALAYDVERPLDADDHLHITDPVLPEAQFERAPIEAPERLTMQLIEAMASFSPLGAGEMASPTFTSPGVAVAPPLTTAYQPFGMGA